MSLCTEGGACRWIQPWSPSPLCGVRLGRMVVGPGGRAPIPCACRAQSWLCGLLQTQGCGWSWLQWQSMGTSLP